MTELAQAIMDILRDEDALRSAPLFWRGIHYLGTDAMTRRERHAFFAGNGDFYLLPPFKPVRT